MKQLIWFVYDLGIDGDYDGLYTWLDMNEARECGDSVALLKFQYTGNISDALKKDIRKYVKLRMKDRIYVISVNEMGKTVGKFIFGKRKKSPWIGYAGTLLGGDTDYDEA